MHLVKSAREQRWLPGVETTEVEARMATSWFFATNHQRQLAHRQYNFDHGTYKRQDGKGHA